jgi:hypothetical protein
MFIEQENAVLHFEDEYNIIQLRVYYDSRGGHFLSPHCVIEKKK